MGRQPQLLLDVDPLSLPVGTRIGPSEGVRPEADVALFHWGYKHCPRWRSPEAVRWAEERDAAARKQFERRQAEARAQAAGARRQAGPPAPASPWRVTGAVALLGVAIATIWVARSGREQEGPRAAPRMDSRDDGSVAVGDSARSVSSQALAPEPRGESVSLVGVPLPEKPLPGQRKPPCNSGNEVEMRGGCWYRMPDAQPPCKEYSYEWKGACYLPLLSARRQPAADPP